MMLKCVNKGWREERNLRRAWKFWKVLESLRNKSTDSYERNIKTYLKSVGLEGMKEMPLDQIVLLC